MPDHIRQAGKAKDAGAEALCRCYPQEDDCVRHRTGRHGKTYLAMAMAIQAFKNGEVGRIILTRPAIEAGEKLGFLPGDLQSKIDPYLRPLYDALYQIMGRKAISTIRRRG